jgi:phosphoglycerate dehydrogenase-like enzyme
MLNARLFRLMRGGATFINTGRGATVVEADLTAVLQERPDLCALLDVTWPEPPEAGSPLYTLPNVWLSSHIAGSKGDEVRRMADWMIEEYQRCARDGSLRYEVTPQMLERMA